MSIYVDLTCKQKSILVGCEPSDFSRMGAGLGLSLSNEIQVEQV